MVNFSSWNLTDLQVYLKERGVTCSKSRKADLVELCQLACTNNLEVDPNCFLDNIAENIKSKFTISGKVIPDPGTFNGSSDIALLPNIDNSDIYNYLIQFKELYAHKQLKAYRNLDGCQLYEAGYVEKVEFVPEIGDNPMWMKYRKGMMTASSFHRISKLKVSTDPDKLIRFLM